MPVMETNEIAVEYFKEFLGDDFYKYFGQSVIV